MHGLGDRGHAEPEACRPASVGWYGLLLGFSGGVRHHGRPLPPQMAGEYALVCSRYSVLQRRSDRPHGETTRAATLAAGARHRDGGVVHLAPHGVLRGQRPALAPVAFVAPPRTLAPPEPCRVPDFGLGAATPSARSACALTRGSADSVRPRRATASRAEAASVVRPGQYIRLSRFPGWSGFRPLGRSVDHELGAWECDRA
jgi:hypothetical protein